MTPAELESLISVVIALIDAFDKFNVGTALLDEAKYVGEEVTRWLGTEAPAVERVVEVVLQTLLEVRAGSAGAKNPSTEAPMIARAVAALVPPVVPDDATIQTPNNFDQQLNALYEQLDREADDVPQSPMTVPATPAAKGVQHDTLPPDTLPEIDPPAVPPTDPQTPMAKGLTVPAAGGAPAGEPVRVPPVPAPAGTPTRDLTKPEPK